MSVSLYALCCVFQDLAVLFDSVVRGRLQGRRASLSAVQDPCLHTQTDVVLQTLEHKLNMWQSLENGG